MLITESWLKEKSACSAGVVWFLAQKETEGVKVLTALIKADKLEWASWLIVRIMKRPQYLAYAIYAAEQVIGIYEKQYPDDKRPRTAIKAAKAVLKNDNPSTRAAAWVAVEAAWAAVEAAIEAAAGAVENSAEASWDFAGASWDSAGAAWAAGAAAAARAAWATAAAAGSAWAAGAARAAVEAAAGAARKKSQLKILEYGIKLIKESN